MPVYLDPVVLLGLTAAAVGYAFALHALILRGMADRVPMSRRLAFAAGLAVLAVALVSPLEPLTGELLWAHMVQHMLLIAIAAPLIAYGAPPLRFAPLIPRRWRRTASRPGRMLLAGRAGGWLVLAALLVALHTVAVWAWHLPGLYELALRSELAHFAEHISFTVTAIAAWSALLGFGGRSKASVTTLGLIFVLAAQGAGLGAAMTFSQAPWYPAYAGSGSLAPLVDQQIAGLVMWAGGGLAPVFVAALLLSGWLRGPARRGKAGLFLPRDAGYGKSYR